MRANTMMLDNILGGTVGTCQTGFRSQNVAKMRPAGPQAVEEAARRSARAEYVIASRPALSTATAGAA